MSRLTLIAALDDNRGLGYQGQLLCHLPEDLVHFKRMTLGHVVVMGRATWDSLPLRFRPLPQRRNVVLSRQKDWKAPGAEVFSDWPSAWTALIQAEKSPETEVFVIGGGQLYAQTLAFADRLVLTHIQGQFPADTTFPEGDWASAWANDADASEWQTSSSGLRFRWVTYQRVRVLG
jgi:dihydrofolate reductase